MRISVRQTGDLWLLTQQGRSAPSYFGVLRDALDEAALRFRSATRNGAASLSVSYVRVPEGEAHGLSLEPEAAL